MVEVLCGEIRLEGVPNFPGLVDVLLLLLLNDSDFRVARAVVPVV